MFLFSYFLFKFNLCKANFASRDNGNASRTFGIAGFKKSAVNIGFSRSRQVAKLSVCKQIVPSIYKSLKADC